MSWFNRNNTEDAGKYDSLLDSYNELQEQTKKSLSDKNKEISDLIKELSVKDKTLEDNKLSIKAFERNIEALKKENIKLNDFYIKSMCSNNNTKELYKIIDNLYEIEHLSKYQDGFLYIDNEFFSIDVSEINMTFKAEDEVLFPIYNNCYLNYTTLYQMGFDYTWNLLKFLREESEFNDEYKFQLDYINNNLNETTPNIIKKIKNKFKIGQELIVDGNVAEDIVLNYPFVSKKLYDTIYDDIGNLGFLDKITINEKVVCFQHSKCKVYTNIDVTNNGVVFPIIKITPNQ
jgi:hypothetical protein